MKIYVDKSDKEFSIHCLEREDLETLMTVLSEQVSKPSIVKNYKTPQQRSRLFNLLIPINSELDNN